MNVRFRFHVDLASIPSAYSDHAASTSSTKAFAAVSPSPASASSDGMLIRKYARQCDPDAEDGVGRYSVIAHQIICPGIPRRNAGSRAASALCAGGNHSPFARQIRCHRPVVTGIFTKRNAVHINQDRRSFHNLKSSGRRRRWVVPSTDSASFSPG